MGAGVPQFKNCCCIISLRQGSLIILWAYLISGILWMCSPTITGGYRSNSTVEVTGTPSNPVIKYGYTLGDSKKLEFLDIYPSFGIFAVICGGVSVIVGGYAVSGIYQYKRDTLKPYLIWEILNLSIIFFVFLVTAFTNSIQLFPLIYLGIFVYFWLVILSQYRAMKNAPKPENVCEEDGF